MSSAQDKGGPTPPILENPVEYETGEVPVLTEAESPPQPRITEKHLASVQAELATLTRDLTDRLLDHAMRDMEAALVEQVSNRLREELPELIERVLREHLEPGD